MGRTHKGVDELQHRAGTESEQAPNASNDSVQLEGTGDLCVLKLTQKKFLKLYSPAATMDSEVLRDGRILDLIDDAWREDKLPYEDVAIPLNELPEPEQDNGGTTESVKEQEMKWTDLALQYLHENIPPTGN